MRILSSLTLYVVMRFDIILKQLLETFSVYTHVGESTLAKRVYLYCTISINYKDIMANLIELDMVDFDIILAMD